MLHITELDVSVFAHEDKRTDLAGPTEEMLERQAERYGQLFRLLKEYSGSITSVTFWGAADDYTWLDHFPVRGRKIGRLSSMRIIIRRNLTGTC